MRYHIISVLAAALMLSACGEKQQNEDSGNNGEMQYIKTSVLHDTIMNIYANPDAYIGKNFHMVGELYPTTDDGEKFYSIYADGTSGQEGIGIELEWSDYSGFQDHETVTVEGTLEKQPRMHDGREQEFLILHVTKLEKRQAN